MLNYLVRRTLGLLPTLLLVAVMSFVIMHMAPGDPVARMLGVRATESRIQKVRADMGLDRPLASQFVSWLAGAVRGDFGLSYVLDRSVAGAIFSRLPVTIILALIGLIIAVALGIPIGVLAAVRRGSLLDQVLSVIAIIGVSVPSFWLALVLIFVFAIHLGILPSGRYVHFTVDTVQAIRHLVLPGLAMGVTSAALIARMSRSCMLDVLRQDYIRTARSKGMNERRVVYRHALRNALIPVVTVAGITFGELLGGAVVLEEVFTLPGVGRLLIGAVNNRDYPVIQGVILAVALTYLLVNLATDIFYVYLDPRIKYG
ncbi:MAG: ABC transporter permease [Bacillota bacterium]